MVIILCLYLVLVWLVFSKLKLVRWGWSSGTWTVLVGAFILAVFLALFNFLTPYGSFVISARVVEITPNVAGQIIAVPVKPNVPVKSGTVLFQIEQAPFQYSVDQLQASLVQTKQQAKELKANYEQATANVEGLTKQLAFQTKRLADYQTMTGEGAQSEFRLQDVQAQYETTLYQLQGAKAAQLSAKYALDSEINGINTAVASTQAQLDNAKWQLEQTTIRAPADGYVTTMALAVGDRALPAQSAMSFIVAEDVRIIGMFSPNGFETIKIGAPVKLVFDNHPGRIYHSVVVDVPRGVGQGQVAVSGTLARSGSVGGAKTFPAEISVPSDFDRQQLLVGMPGTAAVYADNAGVIGVIMTIIIWINSYTAYL